MNELNKTATCPICGSVLHKSEKALFIEHHKRLWKEKCEECGIDPSWDYVAFGEMFYCPGRYGGAHGYRMKGGPQNKPAELIEWEQANPKPQIDLVDFVAALAKALIKAGEAKPDYLAGLLAQQGKSPQEPDMNNFDEKELAVRRRQEAVSNVLIDIAKYVRRAPEYYCRKDIQHFYPIDELKRILDEIEAEVIAPIKDKFFRLYGTTPEEFDNVWRSGLDSMFASSFCRRCAQSPSLPPQIPLTEKDEAGCGGGDSEGR